MKIVGGVWLPDNETHLVEWMTKRNEVVGGKLTYQFHKLTAALSLVKRFNFAIDVGAHCGLHAMHLAQRFNFVDAYEPVPEHRACFEKNVVGGIVTLHPFACGAVPGTVSMKTEPTSTGDTYPDPSRHDGDVKVVRIDDMTAPDVTVDFIKLDCEGFELFALQGAEQLILRSRPAIMVEQKPGKASKFGLGDTDAVKWLQDRGAVLRKEMSGDYLLSWD